MIWIKLGSAGIPAGTPVLALNAHRDAHAPADA